MASRVVTRRLFSSTVRRMTEPKQQLKEDSKRNPETFILGAVMVAALGGAGYYLGRNPTSSLSEADVLITKGSAPWETGSAAKYKYHPNNDPNAEPVESPSALNTTVIPNVTLPKELHDKFNKWGKDGYP